MKPALKKPSTPNQENVAPYKGLKTPKPTYVETRAPRLTNKIIEANEKEQKNVIAALQAARTGKRIAKRILKCQTARMSRKGNPSTLWTWKCKSPGCWACRRTSMRAWWIRLYTWIGTNTVSNDSRDDQVIKDDEISLITIPHDKKAKKNIFRYSQKIRKSLRDSRDHFAAKYSDDKRWAHVTFAGIVDANRVLILIKHIGISRNDVWQKMEWRSDDLMVYDWTTIKEPSYIMTTKQAVWLAKQKDGILPLRFIITEQNIVAKDRWDGEAMPVAI